MERFEVSTRTIYRAVETLSGAGIPIYMNKGKGGGITHLQEFVLNKTVFTEREKKDILSSLGAFGAVSLHDIQNTHDKFTSLFGSSYADWVEVDFGLWSDGKCEALYASAKGEALIGVSME